jgi:hypothetical protein
MSSVAGGTGNVGVGYNASNADPTYSNNIVIGTNAVGTTSNQIVIGTTTQTSLQIPALSTGILQSDASGNIMATGSLSGYATTELLIDYTAASLNGYATTASLIDYTAASLNGYAKTSSLIDGYATTASLGNYATTASLIDYATKASLSNYATTVSLAASLSNYATTTSLINYATTTSLINYATITSLSNYVTIAHPAYPITNTDSIGWSDSMWANPANSNVNNGIWLIATLSGSAFILPTSNQILSSPNASILHPGVYTFTASATCASNAAIYISLSNNPDDNAGINTSNGNGSFAQYCCSVTKTFTLCATAKTTATQLYVGTNIYINTLLNNGDDHSDISLKVVWTRIA